MRIEVKQRVFNSVGAVIENWAEYPSLHNELTWVWARFTFVKSKISNEYFIMFARGSFRVKPPSNHHIFSFFVGTPKWKTKKIFLPRQFETNTPFRILTLPQTIELASYKYRTPWETNNYLGGEWCCHNAYHFTDKRKILLIRDGKNNNDNDNRKNYKKRNLPFTLSVWMMTIIMSKRKRKTTKREIATDY